MSPIFVLLCGLCFQGQPFRLLLSSFAIISFAVVASGKLYFVIVAFSG